MKRFILTILLLSGCYTGSDEPVVPGDYRMNGWYGAHFVHISNGIEHWNAPTEFLVINYSGPYHEFGGFLCESAPDYDGLTCRYSYTDYSWGEPLAMDVTIDGWVNPPDAYFDVWWEIDEEFHSSYTLTELERLY